MNCFSCKLQCPARDDQMSTSSQLSFNWNDSTPIFNRSVELNAFPFQTSAIDVSDNNTNNFRLSLYCSIFTNDPWICSLYTIGFCAIPSQGRPLCTFALLYHKTTEARRERRKIDDCFVVGNSFSTHCY